jgi:hypothetical protein
MVARPRPRFLLFFALFLTASLSADTVKGSFRFGPVKFEPVDAFAYQVDVEGEKTPTTIVAMTSYKIDRPAVLAAIDPVQSFYAQTGGGTGNFVLVRIVAPDKCGIFAGLTTGDRPQDIDLSSSNFPAKNMSSPTRIAGDCFTKAPAKFFDDEYEFHFTYDVPITAIPKPTALAAGGGDPGTQYAALVKAIQASDWDGAHAHVAEGELPATKKKASESNYFEGLQLNYPKNVTVTGGLIKGDRAQLDLRGTSHDGRKITGVVMMKKNGNDWRVLGQQFYGTE